MVEIGRRVKIRYTGRLDDGTVFASSDRHGGEPMEFIVGARQVIPGLDKAVSDMEAFERRTVTIPAAEAYGVYDASLCEAVPVEGFPDVEKLPVGGYITVGLENGQVRVRVDKVEGGMVYLDFNHEYAGRDLVFDIELVEVFGETGSAVENEQHAADCPCGCHRLKSQLAG